jgi:hypothetical protein
VRGLSPTIEAPVPGTFFERMYALTMSREAGRMGMLLWGYPRSILIPLATTLAEQAVRLPGGRDAAAEESPTKIRVTVDEQEYTAGRPVEDDGLDHDDEQDEEDDEADEDDLDDESEEDPDEDDGSDDDARNDELRSQPADSLVTVQELPDGVAIRVPPLGLWKGSRGLMSFAVLWCGFMTLFDGIGIISLLQKGDRFDHVWVFVGFSALFWAVGLGLLAGAVNMGRREAALALAGGVLMVVQKGPFGAKRREWSADEIASVEAGPSGMEINKQPVLELQIVDRGQAKFSVLAGRSDDELRWLAWRLRQALALTNGETRELDQALEESATSAGESETADDSGGA